MTVYSRFEALDLKIGADIESHAAALKELGFQTNRTTIFGDYRSGELAAKEFDVESLTEFYISHGSETSNPITFDQYDVDTLQN